LKSARIGYSLTALPSEGFKGDVPEFPLPQASQRELEVWGQAWSTPQACAWSMESWRWNAVATWVRYAVRMEDPEASAALANVTIRYADQIGLTPAGLKENGWKIAANEVGERSTEKAAAPAQVKSSARDRFKVVPRADGA